MEKPDHIEYWLKAAALDYLSMESNFSMGNFPWALFIGHLVIEKALKALWVKQNETNFPLRTHNLLKLAEETGYNFSEKEKIILNRVNSFNLEARYPDYKFNFYKQCTFEFTQSNINEIKELYQCILRIVSQKL